MPEGPEVRRTADWLKSNLVGCIVRDVQTAGRFVKQPIAGLDSLKNKKVVGVRCKGKVMVLDFEDDVSAISTLGMSGRWTRMEASHTALTLWTELPPTRGMLPIYYVDQRRFGNFVVTGNREATSKLDGLGWDALSEPAAQGKTFWGRSKYAKWKVADVLLKQEVFAGVGNYIRSECLRRACLSPNRLLTSLSDQDWNLLCEEIRNVMREAYESGGTRLRDYQVDELMSTHQFQLRVYGRTHDPNGNLVVKLKCSSGRTIWWCPAVQV